MGREQLQHHRSQGDEDGISFLGYLSPYSPLERIAVLDMVFVHEEAAIKNNMSEALVSTREALKVAVENSKTWHPPSQRLEIRW